MKDAKRRIIEALEKGIKFSRQLGRLYSHPNNANLKYAYRKPYSDKLIIEALEQEGFLILNEKSFYQLNKTWTPTTTKFY
jgi:hypothetical protein